jgi:EmrB/QacA subfamily drug resistance transporter
LEAGVTPVDNGARPGRHLIFAVVSIALLMASIDQTIVATALPALGADLHAKVNWSAWTITIYSLGQVLAMPVAGKLSDQFGRKTVFLLAVGLFTTASLCCGFAGNIYLVIVLRAVQALGGGAFIPSATGIVSDHFGDGRDRAVGLFGSISPMGSIIGPIIGGVLVAYWSWRWIFWVNVPIGAVLIALGLRFIPPSDRRAPGRIDFVGVGLLGATILAAMFGICMVVETGAGSVAFIGPEVIAVAASALFVRHAKRAPEPVVPIELLYSRDFGLMNVINFLWGGAAVGLSALVPLYAENRYHLGTLSSGTLLTARAVAMTAIAGLAVLGLRRTGYRQPMIVGFAVVAVGLLAMAHPPLAGSSYTWLAVAAGITGIGMGLSVPAANNASLQLAPNKAAAIAGLRGMFRQAGSITAVAVATAVIAGSNEPGIAGAWIFVAFAVILCATIPLIRLIPDHHGNW